MALRRRLVSEQVQVMPVTSFCIAVNDREFQAHRVVAELERPRSGGNRLKDPAAGIP